jgi:hypothetical protein
MNADVDVSGWHLVGALKAPCRRRNLIFFWEEEMVSKSVGSQSKIQNVIFLLINFSFVISKETIRHVLINQPFFISDHPF